MSFFQDTFNKAKKTFDKGRQAVEKTTNQVVKETKEVAQNSINILENGAKQAGDFILNSSDREYWNREISTLKSQLRQLQENLQKQQGIYYATKMEYKERYYRYLVISQDTLALGLISTQELENVRDTAGIIADQTTNFYASTDEVEEISRYALGILSIGISEIIFASQEAEKEAQQLREQVTTLEKGLYKMHENIDRHQQGKRKIEQVLETILKLYGDGTTIENVVEKQCAFIVNQALGDHARLNL
jgi:arabinogalactan endo-1,4-beta-galactosidase